MIKNDKLILNGVEYDNPIYSFPLSKKSGKYNEWKEGERTSYRAIWIDKYIYNDKSAIPIGFESFELKISNRGKCFLDDKELKLDEDISSVKEIFNQIKFE